MCDSSGGEQSVRSDRADSTHRFLPWVETSIPWEAAEQEKTGKKKKKASATWPDIDLYLNNSEWPPKDSPQKYGGWWKLH